VAETAARQSRLLGYEQVAEWCDATGRIAHPKKADQDKLDAVLCLLIALHWRTKPRGESMVLGDLTNGYMVSPVSSQVRDYLIIPARKSLVQMDGIVPAG
jgi:predicted RNase H-like nuclease